MYVSLYYITLQKTENNERKKEEIKTSREREGQVERA